MQKAAGEPSGTAGKPGRFVNSGPGPLNDFSGVRAEVHRGLGKGPEGTLTPCPAARWRILHHTY
eukprot:6935519-Pyramimonas_sp.AAC.1